MPPIARLGVLLLEAEMINFPNLRPVPPSLRQVTRAKTDTIKSVQTVAPEPPISTEHFVERRLNSDRRKHAQTNDPDQDKRRDKDRRQSLHIDVKA